MEKEKRIILIKVRDYLLEHPTTKINLYVISQAIGCQFSDLVKCASNPTQLIKLLLDLKAQELAEVLDISKVNSESAIDRMIICGQEIYERFEHISPAKYLFAQTINPDLYNKYQQHKFKLIEEHLNHNFEKGINTGEYKTDINKNDIVNKYTERIKKIHSETYLKSEHFTFSNIFSNIFEEYIKEVATEENWNYFRKRKQFYEAISFINR